MCDTGAWVDGQAALAHLAHRRHVSARRRSYAVRVRVKTNRDNLARCVGGETKKALLALVGVRNLDRAFLSAYARTAIVADKFLSHTFPQQTRP